MTVDSSEFLDSARQMVKSGSEIACRNCISRAYYATFHKAISVAARIRVPQERQCNVGVHEQLIRRLESKENPPEVQAVGQKLRDLKTQRNLADYCLDQNVTVTHAKRAVRRAHRLFLLLEEVSKPKTRVRQSPRQQRKSSRTRR